MSVKMDQDELPEYLVRGTIVYPYDTDTGAVTVTLLAAGHHPKCRVTSAMLISINPGVSVENTADLKLGDATSVVTALDSGTTDYDVITGTVVQDNVVERSEALQLVIGAAGTAFSGILFVGIESID